MLNRFALATVVAIAGCTNALDQDYPAGPPTAHAEEVDGHPPFTRPAVDAFLAHEISSAFAKEKAAAQLADSHPSF